jgi:hypothetical protein
MKDYTGNKLHSEIEAYAKEIGVSEEFIFKIEYEEWFDPEYFSLWKDNLKKIQKDKDDFIVYGKSSKVNNMIQYSEIPKLKLDLLEKIIRKENTIKDITNFLGIKIGVPICL